MTTSTKALLKALRAAGLSARSGFDRNSTPYLECANVVVLARAGVPVVVNVQTFSVLDYKADGYSAPMAHPAYAETKAALAARVRAVLAELGTDHVHGAGGDQFLVNGYRGG